MGLASDGTDGTDWGVQKEFHNSLKQKQSKVQQLMNASIKSDMSIPRNIIQPMN